MATQVTQSDIHLLRFVSGGDSMSLSPDVAGRSYALNTGERADIESRTVARLARTGLFALWCDHRVHRMSGMHVLGVMVVDYARSVLAERSSTLLAHGQKEVVAPTSDYKIYLGGAAVSINADWQKSRQGVVVDIVAIAV